MERNYIKSIKQEGNNNNYDHNDLHHPSYSKEMVHGNCLKIAEMMTDKKKKILNEPGSHILLIYDDLNSLREIYSQYARALLPENEIVVIGAQYETVREVKYTLQFSGIDVERYLNEGMLYVVDAQKGYQGADSLGIWKLAMSLLSRVKKEGRRGLTVFGDLGSFFNFEKIEELVEYEMGLPQKYEDKIIGICCYHLLDFKNLNETQQHMLHEHHFKSVLVQ